MQARMRGLESSEFLYLFNCERRDFGERHSGYLLGRVLHRTLYENDSEGELPQELLSFWFRYPTF